ncbi:sulfur carrier protein ThiS [Pseudoxanthomonas composti]|uniref:Sulfur carrier protein ThiS n=1 Tax=Pseudoxanthomonas composti TaxID=2137479 RepID=A0A4V1N1L7_9GAMM|nr:sulfur carrier protein ThiS [Pseudoxanthomonas composti]RXR08738.1 sulfur carrier protein ThiS [Pseudoxanthomonas composti]
MDITLNGESRTLPGPCTVAELLAQEHIAGHRVAVEVNGEVVTEAQCASRALAPGDEVEVIHALGGP